MSNITIDTETCGFHGPVVLLQWAEGNGPINVHDVWCEPIDKTIELIDHIADNEVIGFNLVFDWFHLCQLYTTLVEYREHYGPDNSVDIEQYAACEAIARDRGCLKPRGACDVLLHARHGKYQSLMDRNRIYIRKVPNAMVGEVLKELELRVTFDPIFFEKAKDKTVWRVQQHKDTRFKNIYVQFRPSTRLKALAKDALQLKDDPLLLQEVALERRYNPLELGYAPFAEAFDRIENWTGSKKKLFNSPWHGAWPSCIQYHIDHWRHYDRARRYASDDVLYTRALYEHFGSPPCDDDDSALACMIGAVRWRGLKVDLDGIKGLRGRAARILQGIPTAPKASRLWVMDSMDEIESLTMPDNMDKKALMTVIEFDEQGAEQLKVINDQKLTPVERDKKLHDIAWERECSKRALAVYEARLAQKQIQICDKYIIADRFHAALKPLGTLSSRMASDANTGSQNINRAKYVRRCFPLSWDGQQLCGGDFDAFEVAIAAAYYDDPLLVDELNKYVDCVYCDGEGSIDLTTPQPANRKVKVLEDGCTCAECHGSGKEKKKIHATMGACVFPGHDYKSIRLTSGQTPDLYTKAKSALFTWLFAGTEMAMEKNLGIPVEQGRAGLALFAGMFPGVAAKRGEAMVNYQPYYQPDGRRGKIFVREHKNSISTMLGFHRYFDLEYQVLHGFYDLINNPPPTWLGPDHGTIRRRDDLQTLYGAVSSAIFSAIFNLQSGISRVAINHPIQGTGAQITKKVQRKVSDIQPCGYHDWIVMPVNIHDELMCPTALGYEQQVKKVVDDVIAELTSVVPMLKMTWCTDLKTWADK